MRGLPVSRNGSSICFAANHVPGPSSLTKKAADSGRACCRPRRVPKAPCRSAGPPTSDDGFSVAPALLAPLLRALSDPRRVILASERSGYKAFGVPVLQGFQWVLPTCCSQPELWARARGRLLRGQKGQFWLGSRTGPRNCGPIPPSSIPLMPSWRLRPPQVDLTHGNPGRTGVPIRERPPDYFSAGSLNFSSEMSALRVNSS